MLVSSETNAAQSRGPGTATRFFDDVGCLAADTSSRADGTERYVHLASGGWISTEAAWFAVSGDTRTPMDYGVLAFSSHEEAQAADGDNQARRWPAIISHAEGR